jgi:hypothetical protein
MSWECVRDSSGKPGAVGNREDLELIARPEGARPTFPEEKLKKRKKREESIPHSHCVCPTHSPPSISWGISDGARTASSGRKLDRGN